MFVTFLLASFELATGTLCLCARRPYPAIPSQRHRQGRAPQLHGRAAARSGRDRRSIRRTPSRFRPGDRVLVVTDGFTEAHDPKGQCMARRKVEEFLLGLEQSEPEPLKRLAGQVRAFEAGRPAFDDMAAILLSLEPKLPHDPHDARFEKSTLPTPEAISDLTDQVMAFLSEQGVETRATHHVALGLGRGFNQSGHARRLPGPAGESRADGRAGQSHRRDRR